MRWNGVMVEWSYFWRLPTMASGGNTWTKKLLNKQRLHLLKVQGVKARWAVEPEVTLGVIKVREFNAPMKANFTPRPFGWRRAAKAAARSGA